jgi:ketosteroid isomerase-like protein
MIKKLSFVAVLILASGSLAFAQTTTRTKTVTVTTVQTTDSKSVRATFDKLIEGIRTTDVDMVTGVYQNSPNTLYFNNNGTVTRGWEQDRKNRESLYKNASDVKLEVRDVRVEMLGTTGAVVTSLWTQTQEYNGVPESASGRMTVVFKKIGKDWKAIHLHTSPDRPDTTRPVFPSERQPITVPN